MSLSYYNTRPWTETQTGQGSFSRTGKKAEKRRNRTGINGPLLASNKRPHKEEKKARYEIGLRSGADE